MTITLAQSLNPDPRAVWIWWANWGKAVKTNRGSGSMQCSRQTGGTFTNLWHFLFLHASLQLLQASPELMEFGSTPSDCFTLAANSCCSYTENGFQASSFFFFFKKYKLFFSFQNLRPRMCIRRSSHIYHHFFFFIWQVRPVSRMESPTSRCRSVSQRGEREARRTSEQTCSRCSTSVNCRWLFLHNFMLIQDLTIFLLFWKGKRHFRLISFTGLYRTKCRPQTELYKPTTYNPFPVAVSSHIV